LVYLTSLGGVIFPLIKKSSHGQMELTTFPYKVWDCGQRNRICVANPSVPWMAGFFKQMYFLRLYFTYKVNSS